jgi:aspartate carbamoyltransferase regulatory subunit
MAVRRLDAGPEGTKELRVTPIKNGTVIDHIPSGMALKVLKILDIDENIGSTVTLLMRAPSKKMGWKDLVKIEDRELQAKEVNKIALIAPEATIAIIRDYSVAEKHLVKLPETVVGILRCANTGCISNGNDPVEPKFHVEGKRPPILRCHYCEREAGDVAAQIV